MECAALGDLYFAMNGAGWWQNAGWSSAASGSRADACTFYHVTCDNGMVTRLDLSSNNLNGSIPSSLGNLTKLIGLFLDGNNLNGTIPSSLGSLTNLHWLYLQASHLSGTIPIALSSLTNLGELILAFNNLGGTIPSSLGSLTSLYAMWLQDNYNLAGTIPSALSSMTSLHSLVLGPNNLSGTIPLSLSSLVNMQHLYLNGSGLCGENPIPCIPADGALPACPSPPSPPLPSPSPPFPGRGIFTCTSGNDPVVCSALGDLYYATNGPTGWTHTGGWSSAAAGTPTDYCSFWQSNGSPCNGLGVLTRLELWSGPLNGPLPSSMGDLTSLTVLYLAANQLSGTIPSSMGSLTSLSVLGLDHNQLSGTIPSSMGSLTSVSALALINSGLCGADPIPFNNYVPDDGALPACHSQPSPPLEPSPPAWSEGIQVLLGDTPLALSTGSTTLNSTIVNFAGPVAYTLSVWYKLTSLCGEWHNIVLRGSEMPGRTPALFMHSDYRLFVSHANVFNWFSTTVFQPEYWYHLSVVADAENHVMQLYVNGTLDSVIDTSQFPGVLSWNGQVNAVYASVDGWCHGSASIRDVSWLNMPASASDVTYLMNAHL